MRFAGRIRATRAWNNHGDLLRSSFTRACTRTEYVERFELPVNACLHFVQSLVVC